MNTGPESSNLPAQIADAITSVPKAMVPGVVKALDRLLGAAVDVPVAWLEQKKASINAQTESYKLVEASIAATVASDAGSHAETTQRAMNVLVRKEYRKQINREAVAAAMVEEMQEHVSEVTGDAAVAPDSELDEDWLNVFERYAEDASSDRFQKLWGRVVAGEIRRPGHFSTRTLRFLSEFSQADALTFEQFSKIAFGDASPKKLAMPQDKVDIRDLINLESSGLIQGASGLGLERTLIFNNNGYAFIYDDKLCIAMKGQPGSSVKHEVIALTPLGQELLALIPNRDSRKAAKAVAHAYQVPKIHECHLGVWTNIGAGIKFDIIETLWLKETIKEPVMQDTSDVSTN